MFPDEGVPHNTVVMFLYYRLELLYVTALISTEITYLMVKTEHSHCKIVISRIIEKQIWRMKTNN